MGKCLMALFALIVWVIGTLATLCVWTAFSLRDAYFVIAIVWPIAVIWVVLKALFYAVKLVLWALVESVRDLIIMLKGS